MTTLGHEVGAPPQAKSVIECHGHKGGVFKCLSHHKRERGGGVKNVSFPSMKRGGGHGTNQIFKNGN